MCCGQSLSLLVCFCRILGTGDKRISPLSANIENAKPATGAAGREWADYPASVCRSNATINGLTDADVAMSSIAFADNGAGVGLRHLAGADRGSRCVSS